jgi:geranylgeranylglycerol-phosphate geranylgeranyltransferase
MNKPVLEPKVKVPGKWTMKEPYTKTRFLSQQARGALDLFRPFTLLAPFIVSMAIMVASLIYNYNNPVNNHVLKEIPEYWWITVGQAAFTIVLVNAASNSLNQSADVEADRISKPYRPIPRGIIRADSAQSLAYLLYLFALLRAITINFWFGVFIFLIIVFTVTYSLPPRMKKYLFINQIWIAIPRGMLGTLASWSVFIPQGTHPFQATPLIIGGIAMTYLIGGMATKDITDAEADRATGTHTLINTIGVKKTALVCLPFMLFPFLFIFIFIHAGLIDAYLWPLSLFMFLSLFIFYLMVKGLESKTLENVHAWSIMYVEYIFFALAFALLTIFSDKITILNFV